MSPKLAKTKNEDTSSVKSLNFQKRVATEILKNLNF